MDAKNKINKNLKSLSIKHEPPQNDLLQSKTLSTVIQSKLSALSCLDVDKELILSSDSFSPDRKDAFIPQCFQGSIQNLRKIYNISQ